MFYQFYDSVTVAGPVLQPLPSSQVKKPKRTRKQEELQIELSKLRVQLEVQKDTQTPFLNSKVRDEFTTQDTASYDNKITVLQNRMKKRRELHCRMWVTCLPPLSRPQTCFFDFHSTFALFSYTYLVVTNRKARMGHIEPNIRYCVRWW